MDMILRRSKWLVIVLLYSIMPSLGIGCWKNNCYDCIRTPHLDCAWCTDPQENDKRRCFQPSLRQRITCREEYIFSPLKSVEIIPAGPLNKSTGDPEYQESRILKMRAGNRETIQLSYNQTEDSPLDIYILMDPSKFTGTGKLTNFIEELTTILKNLSTNFRIGFGSFVHQPEENDENYVYKHVMSLSSDTHQFLDLIKKTVIGIASTLSASEEGFSALLQTIICREKIGWRERSKKFLVVITGNTFDYAEDEEFQTNDISVNDDVKCKLNGTDIMQKVSHKMLLTNVNVSIAEHSINVLFLVPRNVFLEYEDIVRNLKGAKVVTLEEDAEKFKSFLENNYKHTTSSVELKHNATSLIEVTIITTCGNGPWQYINKCENVKKGEEIIFYTNLKMEKCPENPADYLQSIEFSFVGTDQKDFLEFEAICSCGCEQPGDERYIEKAQYCSFAGTDKCGICECGPNFFGRNCECSSLNVRRSLTGIDCKNPSGLVCSGRGKCVCGQCVCEVRDNPEEVISGKICECDNYSCDRYNGTLCGGPDRGICVCGACICEKEWSGSDCSCNFSDPSC